MGYAERAKIPLSQVGVILTRLDVRKEPGLQAKKPFYLMADGLVSKKCRGDWTPIELFGEVVEAWTRTVQQLLLAA